MFKFITVNKNIQYLFSIFFLCIAINCSNADLVDGDVEDPINEELPENIEYAAVFNKLKKGVNQDVSMPAGGPWIKVQHERAHMQAIKEAGFESVRIFMPFNSNINEYEQRIQDALDYNLAVVLCLWGHYQWHNNNIEVSSGQIADFWGNLADKWKTKFSNDVVFEILNEPEGIGFPESRNEDVMKMYNSAVKAIRDKDEDRPILVSSGGHNDADQMDGWVDDNHLDYKFSDDIGFFDDPNIGVAIHFYAPRHGDAVNYAMWTADLTGNWRSAIDKHLDKAIEWQEKNETNMPIVVTEWGSWIFENRTNSAGFPQWLNYHISKFEEYNFGSMWYTGIQNNQRHFGVFDSEFGWNQVVLNALTGVTPSTIPGTNQLIDSEFSWNSSTWTTNSNSITKTHQSSGALSGGNSLRVSVSNTGDYIMYQQSITDPVNGEPQAPGRTLLHLLKDETYEISFMAKSLSGEGQLKIFLKDVNNLDNIFYESDVQSISGNGETFSMFYTHTGEIAMDVRFEFQLGLKQQTLLLDKIVLKRQ